jgi:hypothetical protein
MQQSSNPSKQQEKEESETTQFACLKKMDGRTQNNEDSICKIDGREKLKTRKRMKSKSRKVKVERSPGIKSKIERKKWCV